MAGVAFAVEGDGVSFATGSYAASALYTTLASLSGALWRIRRVSTPETRDRRKSIPARRSALQSELGIPNLPAVVAENLAIFHSKQGPAVLIEPGLRSLSPENGNISNIRRRLSANPSRKRPNPESRDQPPIRKSPPLAGISGIAEGRISRRRTGWPE